LRRILLLTGAIVLVDTLFFAALTPLLPHYAHRLGLGKAGAGFLAASYPLGALVGSIPSGIVAARLGVKPTVLAGLTLRVPVRSPEPEVDLEAETEPAE
jgi:Major Facilitator Superfamily.